MEIPNHSRPEANPRPLSVARATALRVAGLVFLGLAAVGVVLPGLPTTPLVLVAAACFARSSPRLYRWLLANRVFGPLIRNWEAHRSISPGARRTAITMIVVVGVVTVGFLLSNLVLRIVVGLTMLAVIVWLSRLPVRQAETARRPDAERTASGEV